MSYLVINKNGDEFIYAFKPERGEETWKPQLFHVHNTPVMEETAYIKLPEGSIRKLIGKTLSWEDEPYELTKLPNAREGWEQMFKNYVEEEEEKTTSILYVKKPIVIEAIQFDGYNTEEIKSFCGDSCMTGFLDKIVIHTLEGNMNASIGDYIIKGINGEFYPCKPDIFEKTYNKLD